MDENNLPKELSQFLNSEYFKENVKILNEKVAKGELDKNKTFAISLNPDDMVNKIPGTNFIEVTGNFQLPISEPISDLTINRGPKGVNENNETKISTNKNVNIDQEDFSKIKPLFKNI